MSAAWWTVAQMQGRDLVRRRAALLLLIGLPMSWYGAEAAAGIGYAVGTGVLAMAWSAAAAPLFAFVSARHADQRLVHAGYRPRDIVLGRLLALVTLSTTLALIVGAVMALVGLQVSIPVSGSADLAIPYYGPLRLTDYDRSPVGPAGPTLHSLAWSLLIGLVALALWRRHVVIRTAAAEQHLDRNRTERRPGHDDTSRGRATEPNV